MNAAEAKAYRRLRKLPRKSEISRNLGMKRISEERFRAQHKALVAHKKHTAPVYESLRRLVTRSSEFDGVKAALSLLKRPRPPALLKPTRVPGPRSPRLRFGSIHVVEVPPFTMGTWSMQIGNNLILTTADQNGNLDAEIGTRAFVPGVHGDGHASCWAASGQSFTVETEGILRFTASPSFSWDANWFSTYWRQAAGLIWIGQSISRFDPSGALVDTPISTEIPVFAFSDYNFCDGGMMTGSNTGFMLQSQVLVQPGTICKCSIVAGCSANANGYNSQSYARVRIKVSFGSFILDIL